MSAKQVNMKGNAKKTMPTYIITVIDDDPWAGLLPEPQAPKPKPEATSPPIDTATRRALFASLRDVYGWDVDIDRERRLDIVSKLAGRKIDSLSQHGNMTMADAHRVLDILHTLP